MSHLIDPGSCKDELTINFMTSDTGVKTEVKLKVTSPFVFIAPVRSIVVSLSTCIRLIPNIIMDVDLEASYNVSGMYNIIMIVLQFINYYTRGQHHSMTNSIFHPSDE